MVTEMVTSHGQRCSKVKRDLELGFEIRDPDRSNNIDYDEFVNKIHYMKSMNSQRRRPLNLGG